MRTRIAQLAVAVCLLAVGCGPTKTTATGKVTFQGKPVTWGSVTLIAADGVAYPGVLQADGSFEIPGVPAGSVRVVVRSPHPAPPSGRTGPPTSTPADAKVGATPQAAVPGWFPIPERYADPERSGLKAEVKAGEPLKIELK